MPYANSSQCSSDTPLNFGDPEIAPVAANHPMTELRKNPSRFHQSGFTLIETTIALVIMMIVGLAGASLFMYAVNQNMGANQTSATLAVAQRHMEIVRNATFDSLITSTTTAENAGRSFTVVVTVENQNLITTTTEPERKLIRIQVTPRDARPWSGGTITLTTLRSAVKPGPNRKPNAVAT